MLADIAAPSYPRRVTESTLLINPSSPVSPDIGLTAALFSDFDSQRPLAHAANDDRLFRSKPRRRLLAEVRQRQTGLRGDLSM